MITPMEIQNKDFASKWKGFDPEEVKHFLYLMAEEFENLIERNHKATREVSILRERLKDLEARDKILKDTLISAQQIKTDIHENATKEADLIIKEANLKADAMFEAAKAKVYQLRQQMVETRRVRDDLLAEAEMMVNRFNHFVDAERQMADESDKLHNFSIRKKAEQQPATEAPVRRVVR